MIRHAVLVAAFLGAGLAGFVAISPATAASTTGQPAPIVREWDGFQVEGDRIAVEEPITWTLVVMAAGAIIGATFYLLKRQVGAFPKDPDWVAPISIMPAGENAEDEADFPPPPADHH